MSCNHLNKTVMINCYQPFGDFFGGMRLIDANTFKAMKTLELCSKMKAHGTPSNSLIYMQSPSSGSGNKNEASVIKRAKAP